MDVVFHAFSGILTVMLIVMTGFALERRGWFSDDTMHLVSRMVNNICLPTFMLANLTEEFDRAQLLEMGRGAGLPLLSMLAAYLLAKFLAGPFKIPRERRGVFIGCVTFSSVIFQGLPLCIAFFGDVSVPYVMLYYMANALLFWTIGLHEVAASGGDRTPLFSASTVKVLLSPPLLGYVFGVIFILMGIKLPAPIYKSCYYIGSMTTPLAMLFVGISLSRAEWSEIKPDFQLAAPVIGRFLAGPLILIAMLPFFGVGGIIAKVFVICAALPSPTNLSILSKIYGGDYKYGAMLVAVTTCLSAAVLPFYVWLVEVIW